MRNILVHVHADDGQEARMRAAIDIARALGGHLDCVYVNPYSTYVTGDPFGGAYVLPELFEQAQRREEEERQRVDARLGREAIPWEWVRHDGDPAKWIVASARLADLIVLSRAVHAPRPHDPIPVVADVALHALAPVLAVPPDHPGIDVGGPALVAWNGSFEAAHVLRFAVPLLARASAVHVATVAEGSTDAGAAEACSYLARYGVAAQPRPVERRGRAVGDALLGEAADTGASYLVAGAYGHSRMREYLLGGVTRDLLGHSSVPLLLAH